MTAPGDLPHALLASAADLRLRVVQAQALATMIDQRPDLLTKLLPLLHEALDAPPAVERAITPTADYGWTLPNLEHLAPPPPRLPPKPTVVDLPPRMLQVLQALADGLNGPQTARLLHLSESTVHTYRNRLMSRLEAKTAGGLVAAGFRHHLIT